MNKGYVEHFGWAAAHTTQYPSSYIIYIYLYINNVTRRTLKPSNFRAPPPRLGEHPPPSNRCRRRRRLLHHRSLPSHPTSPTQVWPPTPPLILILFAPIVLCRRSVRGAGFVAWAGGGSNFAKWWRIRLILGAFLSGPEALIGAGVVCGGIWARWWEGWCAVRGGGVAGGCAGLCRYYVYLTVEFYFWCCGN